MPATSAGMTDADSLFARPSLPIGFQRKLHEIIVHLTGVLLDILNGNGNKLPV